MYAKMVASIFMFLSAASPALGSGPEDINNSQIAIQHSGGRGPGISYTLVLFPDGLVIYSKYPRDRTSYIPLYSRSSITPQQYREIFLEFQKNKFFPHRSTTVCRPVLDAGNTYSLVTLNGKEYDSGLDRHCKPHAELMNLIAKIRVMTGTSR